VRVAKLAGLSMFIASLAKLAVFNCSLRSLRCSPGAAVFVGSDETIRVAENALFSEVFRRLLLQSCGANIAGADRALEAAVFLTRFAASWYGKVGR
jgi:hypothetical protein